MKTKELIQAEIPFGEVFTLDEFIAEVEENWINEYDGIGYFHDGENRTDFSVWNEHYSWDDVIRFPYVIWYNK